MCVCFPLNLLSFGKDNAKYFACFNSPFRRKKKKCPFPTPPLQSPQAVAAKFEELYLLQCGLTPARLIDSSLEGSIYELIGCIIYAYNQLPTEENGCMK